MAAAMAGGVSTIAVKLFRTEHTKVKLIVFFATIALALVLALIGTTVIERKEWSDSPVPLYPIAVGSNQDSSSFLRSHTIFADAQAQANTDWIYCGEYDFSEQRWVERNLDLGALTPTEMVNEILMVEKRLAVFDRRPNFSRLTLKWNFGAISRYLTPGQTLKVEEMELLGKDKIWCRVKVGE
jgi:hypothetical protein